MTGVVHSRWAVVGVVVVALVASLAVVAWQWRHPHAFRDAGGWGVIGHDTVGQHMYVGMSYDRDGEHETATIHHVTADVAVNSSAARIKFYVCRVDPAQRVGAIGSLNGSVRRYCLSLVPVHEAKLGLGRHPMDQIIMGLFPTRPGRVTVRNVEVTYSRGWQTGTQRVGGRITLRTAP